MGSASSRPKQTLSHTPGALQEDPDHQVTGKIPVLTPTGLKGLVIYYRERGGGGGLQNGKIAGLKLFAPPPSPQDRVKPFPPPPLFKEWKLFAPPFQYC